MAHVAERFTLCELSCDLGFSNSVVIVSIQKVSYGGMVGLKTDWSSGKRDGCRITGHIEYS